MPPRSTRYESFAFHTATVTNAVGNVFNSGGIGAGSFHVQISGQFTVNFKASNDGINFHPFAVKNSAGADVTTATVSGIYLSNAAPYAWIRADTSNVGATSTAVVTGVFID